ncbi:hypothetical protein UPYG_G00333980 [Umbra pygmaea]|uniref:C3H1-type domain-containing protein n=1 Tax=Umbra pygmaea TaxID=75934 RepID=A0ABD0VXK3_UMBPY
MYSFVNDKFMPPDDPLGRHGPTLDNFLRKVPQLPRKQPCPYGKKCTYGIKCKFDHPERAKQSSRSLADELREKAKLPVSLPKHLARGPGPISGCSLDEMVSQKPTVGQWNSSLKNAHTSENVLLLRGAHPSSHRSLSKKDKARRTSPTSLDPALPTGSQEHLDSGLGSFESQVSDSSSYCSGNAWYRTCHSRSTLSVRPQGSSLSCNNPACCCSNAQLSLGVTARYHQHLSPGQSMAPAGTYPTHNHPDVIPYCSPCYPAYGAPVFPGCMSQYSHAKDFHQQGRAQAPTHTYWSDPFGTYPQTLLSAAQGEQSKHWSDPNQTKTSPHGCERQEVRKKLLAIFNGRLVDKAMDKFPQLMDPQRLAAEILTLQSRGL